MGRFEGQVAESSALWDVRDYVEIKLRIPTNDPRFAPLLAEIMPAGGAGKRSKRPRMLMEWALIGRALMRGELGGQRESS